MSEIKEKEYSEDLITVLIYRSDRAELERYKRKGERLADALHRVLMAVKMFAENP
jgi:hypothetical protein